MRIRGAQKLMDPDTQVLHDPCRYSTTGLLYKFYVHMCRVMKVDHMCIHYSANPGTNKDCSYANTYLQYSINTEKPSKLKEKTACSKERIYVVWASSLINWSCLEWLKFEFSGFIHEYMLFTSYPDTLISPFFVKIKRISKFN